MFAVHRQEVVERELNGGRLEKLNVVYGALQGLDLYRHRNEEKGKLVEANFVN